jgi:protein NDRG1
MHYYRSVLCDVCQFSKANDKEELKAIVESYQESLRNKTNPKNLKKFVEAFLK